jgi:hypothetical protein
MEGAETVCDERCARKVRKDCVKRIAWCSDRLTVKDVYVFSDAKPVANAVVVRLGACGYSSAALDRRRSYKRYLID